MPVTLGVGNTIVGLYELGVESKAVIDEIDD